jgi:nucleoside-diphosphate-sugar epimerase
MKILVTGSAGFLGARIVESLLANGADDVRLHVRSQVAPGVLEDLRARYPGASIESGAANLLGRDLDALVAGVDCVVHAAAGMRGAAADMFANTVVATRNLLDACVRNGVKRIVLVSSFAVFRTAHLSSGATLDENVPSETTGVEKGAYGYAKTRQEKLVDEYRERHGFELVRLRPGVIYGPRGGALSPRVGIKAMGWFFALGNGATLPLTYVDNCADAIAIAALRAPDDSVFSVVDDDLPSCAEYLRGYRARVEKLRVLPVPYWALLLGSRHLERYHKRSKGQLPAVFTPYVVRSMYRPLKYPNAALKAIGWTPRIPTAEGMRRAFHWLAASKKSASTA